MTISPVSRSSNSYYVQPIRKVRDTAVADHVNVVQVNVKEPVNSQENVSSTNKQNTQITDRATGVANAQNILSAQVNRDVLNKTQKVSNEDDNVDTNSEQQNTITTEDEQNEINNISINTSSGERERNLDEITTTLEKIREQVVYASNSSSNEYREFSQEQINQLLEELKLNLEDIDMGYDIEKLGLEDIDVTDDASIHNSLKSVDNAIDLISYKKENPFGLSSITINDVADDLEKLYALGTTASETNSSGYKELLQEEVEKIKSNIADTLKGTGVTLKDLKIEGFDVTGKFSLNTIHNAIEGITNKQSTLGQKNHVYSEEYLSDLRNKNKSVGNDNSAWQEVLQKFTNFSDTYQYRSYMNMLNLFSGGHSQVATTFNMFS
ncbi:hypothetical protein AN644_05005 [Candidatus Epulonipiscium fishelsonii]|nr:hypothetical protein AN644_05005 [Epulopiscium sp. SCG-C06WGA-EpuloA1]